MRSQDLANLSPLVDRLAKPDSVLLLWGTWPKMDEAVDLVRAWGFRHVTGFPWIKVVPSSGTIRRGVGFWTMGASEFVIVATRGKPVRVRPGKPPIGLLVGEPRAFYDRIAKHSRKPYGIAEWVEESFPGGTYLELFATETRPGWKCLGHGTGFHLTPAGVLELEDAIEKGLLPAGFDPNRARRPDESIWKPPARATRNSTCSARLPERTKER